MPNIITAGYYQPKVTFDYDPKSSNWFVDGKPTTYARLSDYPCYTLNNDYSELGSHCIVLGDELYQHQVECDALDDIIFDEALNNPRTKIGKPVQELLSKLFFVYADNAFYFVIADKGTIKILPYSINAYQLTSYAKEIQVYIDLFDTEEIYRTNIVIFTKDQDARFLRRQDDNLTMASTILKTGNLTQRIPDIQDGFEDVDQSEAILATSGTAVALNNNQTSIDDIKQLVKSALDALPDKGDVTQHKSPLEVNIIPAAYDVSMSDLAQTDAVLKCHGCSGDARWVQAYTGDILEAAKQETPAAIFDTKEAVELIALIAASQCATTSVTYSTLEDLSTAFFFNYPTIQPLLSQDFVFPDAIQFFKLYGYKLNSLANSDIEDIIKCDFSDSAFKILSRALNSSYSLQSVKNFLRKRSIYRSGQKDLPNTLPFALSPKEFAAVQMSFAHAGLIQGARLPSYMRYKCLDIILNGPFVIQYLLGGREPSIKGLNSYAYDQARLKNAIGDDPELLAKKSKQDGVDYLKKADFTYATDIYDYASSSNAWQSVVNSSNYNKSADKLDAMRATLPYKYSLLSRYCDYQLSDLFDWLLILNGLTPIVPSLKHTYREVALLEGHTWYDAIDTTAMRYVYGLVLLVSLWQRLTLGTITTNPDPVCKFNFNQHLLLGNQEQVYSHASSLKVRAKAQLRGLAFGWASKLKSNKLFSYANAYHLNSSEVEIDAKDALFYINDEIAINKPAHRQRLGLESYTYNNLPKKTMITHLDVTGYYVDEFVAGRRPDWCKIKIEVDISKLANNGFVEQLSIFPDHIVLPAFVNTGTRIATFDELLKNASNEGKKVEVEVYKAAMVDDNQFIIDRATNTQDLRTEREVSVEQGDWVRFLLGELGKVMNIPSNSSESVKYDLLDLMSGTYSSGMYINDRVNAAIVLSDNTKPSSFLNQYTKALEQFCKTTSSLLSKVTDETQLGIVLQSYVGFLQSNLDGYTYKDLNNLLERTPDIQSAVSDYLSKIADKYPDIMHKAYSYHQIINNLGTDSGTSTAELEETIQHSTNFPFAKNTDVANIEAGILDLENTAYQTKGLRALQPRFSLLRSVVDISNANKEAEKAKDALASAIQEQQGIDNHTPEPEVENPDDILQRELIDSFETEDMDEDDGFDEIPDELTKHDSEDDEFDAIPDDFGAPLNALYSLNDAKRTQEVSQFAEANKPDDDTVITTAPIQVDADTAPLVISSPDMKKDAGGEATLIINSPDTASETATEPSGAAPLIINAPKTEDTATETDGEAPLIINSPTQEDISPAPLIINSPNTASEGTAQDNSPAPLIINSPDTDTEPKQDGVVLNLDNPSFGSQVETDTKTNINTSVFTDITKPDIPNITKPVFVFTPSSQEASPQGTTTQPSVQAPPPQSTIKQPIPAQPAPLIINTPPKSTDNLVINTPDSKDVKPADTDEVLYSSDVIAPIMTEAKNASRELARCNLVITPEREGFARTEYIEPTVAALIAYCEKNHAICYNTQANEIYLIKGNAKMYVCLLHRHADKVIKAIVRGRFSLNNYPLPKLMLNHLV